MNKGIGVPDGLERPVHFDLTARTVPAGVPIEPETFERLLAALERHYPGKVRRAVDVCPVAVNKTIDNEADALETIRRCELAQAVTPPPAHDPPETKR